MMESLAQLVHGADSLTALNLSHCALADETLGAFVKNIESSNLQELDLSWNKLTTKTCADLRSVLEKSPKLKTLFLQHNAVGGYSFTRLASGIRAHKSLIYLDVSHNKLGNSGFTELFDPVSKNKTKIERLECRGNDLGGRLLDNVLSCVSRSLKILDLS